MKIREDVARLRNEILAAAREAGAANVRLFGSAARGEDRQNSDVDLLVSLERGRTLMDLARLELRLEQLLGRHVDVVTEESIRSALRPDITRDAIAI